MNYAALKAKYSGQDVPAWELELHGLAKAEAPQVEASADAPVEELAPKKPRRRKTEG